jgi:hypothetical protein
MPLDPVVIILAENAECTQTTLFRAFRQAEKAQKGRKFSDDSKCEAVDPLELESDNGDAYVLCLRLFLEMIFALLREVAFARS